MLVNLEKNDIYKIIYGFSNYICRNVVLNLRILIIFCEKIFYFLILFFLVGFIINILYWLFDILLDYESRIIFE